MKQEIEHALGLAIGVGVVVGLALFLLNGCGPRAGASDVRAIEIPGPVNTVCFAIMDGITVKGGNCLRAW